MKYWYYIIPYCVILSVPLLGIPFFAPKYAVYDTSTREFEWGKTQVNATASLNNEKLKRGQLRFQILAWFDELDHHCDLVVENYEIKQASGEILYGNTSIPDLTIRENAPYANLNPDLVFFWAAKEHVSLSNLNISMTISAGDSCKLVNSTVQIEHDVYLKIKRTSLWRIISDLVVFAT